MRLLRRYVKDAYQLAVNSFNVNEVQLSGKLLSV